MNLPRPHLDRVRKNILLSSLLVLADLLLFPLMAVIFDLLQPTPKVILWTTFTGLAMVVSIYTLVGRKGIK